MAQARAACRPGGWAALQFVSIVTPLFRASSWVFVSNSKASYKEAKLTGQHPETVLYKSDAYVATTKNYGIA